MTFDILYNFTKAYRVQGLVHFIVYQTDIDHMKISGSLMQG